jgi:hypothetical protein
MTAQLSPLFTWRTAIAKSDLPPTARHVALTLSLYMNERGGSAWPSLSTLAGDSGLSTRSIMRAIRVLEREHYLLCEKRPGTSTLYTATAPTQVSFDDSLTGVTVSPPSQWHPTPDTESPHPGHSVTRSSQEHVNTTPEGQGPSPSAPEENRNGHKPFHLADVVNLHLVVTLKDRYRRRKPWDGVTEGLLTGLVLGGRQGPGFGARAVNAAIDDLYENAAGVSNPAGYLRERSEAHASSSTSSTAQGG